MALAAFWRCFRSRSNGAEPRACTAVTTAPVTGERHACHEAAADESATPAGSRAARVRPWRRGRAPKSMSLAAGKIADDVPLPAIQPLPAVPAGLVYPLDTALVPRFHSLPRRASFYPSICLSACKRYTSRTLLRHVDRAGPRRRELFRFREVFKCRAVGLSCRRRSYRCRSPFQGSRRRRQRSRPPRQNISIT